jgi:hypothetical protein
MTAMHKRFPYDPAKRSGRNYINENGSRVPVAECCCGVVYDPLCPVDVHAERASHEKLHKIPEFAEHLEQRREKALTK